VPEAVAVDKAGLAAVDLTPKLAKPLTYKESLAGALITQVDDDSPAASAGLSRWMVVTKVDHQPVKSAKDLAEVLDKAALDKGVLLQVETPVDGVSYVLLKK
jgi:S1-C subfamily serine protease